MYMSVSPAVPLLRNYPIEIKVSVSKDKYTRMIIPHLPWQKDETKRMPFSRRIVRQTVIHSYRGVLYNHKKRMD